MPREIPFTAVEENDAMVTKRSLAVLTASIVSTDGVLSAPLQLGAKLLLSRAATLCPGTDSVKWTVPLKTIDSEIVTDVVSYIKTIKDYKEIRPLRRRLIEPGERLTHTFVFHDASVSTVSSIIYLVLEDGNGERHMRIVKCGTKCQNASIPVLEHISRTYGIVLIKPLLMIIKNIGGRGVKWRFIGDSTCSLKLMREDIKTTNKLSSNTKAQLEQLGMLSEMFSEGDIKVMWVPSKLNTADLLTRASNQPIEIVNSEFYRNGILPSGEKLVDMIFKMEDENTFLTVSNGTSEFLARDDTKLCDLGFYDKTRRRIQEKKKINQSIVGAVKERRCNNTCEMAECVAAQEDWKEFEENSIEEIEQNIADRNILDSHFNIIGAVTRKKPKLVHVSNNCKSGCTVDKNHCQCQEWKNWKVLKVFVNKLNLKRSEMPMYTVYKPLIKERLVSDSNYEAIMDNESLGMKRLVRQLSYGIMKVAPALKVNQIFIPVYESFHQLVLASQQLHPINEAECKKHQMNLHKSEEGVLLNTVRKSGSDKTGRVFPVIADQRFKKK